MKSVVLGLILSIGVSFGVVAAQEPAAADFAPGTLVIVDFGGKSVGEVVEKRRTGWFRVRMKSSTGREISPTFPPDQIKLAAPDAVFGERIEKSGADDKPGATPSATPRTRRSTSTPVPAGTAAAGAPARGAAGAPAGGAMGLPKRGGLAAPAGADLPRAGSDPALRFPTNRMGTGFSPIGNSQFPQGTLVVVEYLGRRVGRVIGQSGGSRTVRVLAPDGFDEIEVPAARLTLATAEQPFGFDLNTGKMVEVTRGKKPTPPASTPARAAKPVAKQHKIAPGTYVLIDIQGRRVAKLGAQHPSLEFDISYIGADGVEVTKKMYPNLIYFAQPMHEYGLDLESGEILTPGTASTLTDAARLTLRNETRKANSGKESRFEIITATLPAATSAGEAAMKPLVGEWEILESNRHGRDVPSHRGKKVAFTATTIRFPPRGPGDTGLDAECRLNPTQSPKRIDFRTNLEGSVEPASMGGIYELVGDTLRLSLADTDYVTGIVGDRPTKFGAPANRDAIHLVLKRVR